MLQGIWVYLIDSWLLRFSVHVQHLSRALEVFFRILWEKFAQFFNGSKRLKRIGGTVCSLCFSGAAINHHANP